MLFCKGNAQLKANGFRHQVMLLVKIIVIVDCQATDFSKHHADKLVGWAEINCLSMDAIRDISRHGNEMAFI